MNKNKLSTFNILGVNISSIDMADACSAIKEAMLKREKMYVCVTPVSTIMECRKNASVMELVRHAGLKIPWTEMSVRVQLPSEVGNQI